jgi:hypothetical protein
MNSFKEPKTEEALWLNEFVDCLHRDFQEKIFRQRRNIFDKKVVHFIVPGIMLNIFLKKGLNEEQVKKNLLSGKNFNATEALELG